VGGNMDVRQTQRCGRLLFAVCKASHDLKASFVLFESCSLFGLSCPILKLKKGMIEKLCLSVIIRADG
jgi:hypothetical protein